MRVLALALMLAASAASASALPDEDDLDVRPDWVRRPDPEQIQALWPKDALAKGLGGRAVIECLVTLQSALENCKVVSEKPAGEGFGAAALLLAPSFVIRPGMKDGKPVASSVRIPVDFKTVEPAGGFVDKVPIVADPVWQAAPSFADMSSAWPKGATSAFGHVSMRCRLTRAGELEHCEVLTETPRGDGFGKAARNLTSRFRLRVDPGSENEIAKASVNLAVHFTNPTSTAPRTVVSPRWITGLDPAKVQAIYPGKAADAGIKSGKGYADCAVAADGHLVDCKPSGAAPDGLGFAEAAVKVASVMQMNPWTGGGGPVDGVRIRLPIAFNLAADPAKP